MTGALRLALKMALVAMTLVAFSFAGSTSSAFASPSAGGEIAKPHVNLKDFGYKSKDAEGGTLETGEAHMAPPLLAQMFNFVIFAGLLLVLVGPRIKKVMAKRHDEVKTALKEAATMKAEAAAKLADYKKRIADVDKEVDELVASIKSDAEAERLRIAAHAEEQAASLKRDAEDRIAASIGRARAGLEAEVVAAALAAAEQVLRSQATDSDQNNLVEQFIASLEQDKPSGPKGSSGSGGSGGGDKPTPSQPREQRESEVDLGWS